MPIYDNFNQNDVYFSDEQKLYYKNEYPAILKAQAAFPRRETIQKFRLERLLGEGSFGRVYLGFDETNGVPIAIKQVPITSFGLESSI